MEAANKITENTDMRTVVHQLNNDAKIYETQLENLLKFVDELEHSNKELMRFIDKKNYQDAADYKNRVTELLSRPRGSGGSQEAVLRQPP